MEPKNFFHFALAVVIVATEVNADLSAEKLVTTAIDIIQGINKPTELFKIMFKFFKDLSAPDSSGPTDYTDVKLESISESLNVISADIQEFKESLFDKISTEKDLKDIAEKMGKIYRYKYNIDNLFKKFQNFHNFSIINAGDYLSSTKENFIKNILDDVDKMLQDMKYQLIQVTDIWFPGAAWQLSTSSLTSELVCSRHRPQQLIIHNIYLAYCATEIKALALNVYAVQHSTKAENREDSHVADFLTIKNDFLERMREVTLVFKQAMKRSSRSHWSCEDPRKDTTYLQFGPFIQKYIENELLMQFYSDPNTGHRCKGNCLLHVDSKSDRAPYQGGCSVRLRNCEQLDNSVELCRSKNSTRKYEYAKNGTVLFGKLKSCDETENLESFSTWWVHRQTCPNCLCTCEQSANNRSIDLQMVRAAAINNEVIVGLRFRMKLGLLFMEARTAKLLPSGQIDTESKIWKRKKFQSSDFDKRVRGVDYMVLSWSNRSFVLDDVELGNDYVLTGVKFVYENGFIKLAARGHKFDFKNGTIDTTEEIWIVSGKSKNETEYSELLVENLAIPTDYNDNKINSYNGGVKNENIVQFVNLTTSSMKSDVGQSVVPFIDVKPVVPNQLTPLSGVGLVHKGSRKSAGYLALKIIGYDFEPHVGEESI